MLATQTPANGAHAQDRTREKWLELKEAERAADDARKGWLRLKRAAREKRAEFDRYLESETERLPLYDAAEAAAGRAVGFHARQEQGRLLSVSVDGSPACDSASVRLPVPPARVPADQIPDQAPPQSWRDTPAGELGLPGYDVIFRAEGIATAGDLADRLDGGWKGKRGEAVFRRHCTEALDRCRQAWAAGEVPLPPPEACGIMELYPPGDEASHPGILPSQAMRAGIKTVADALALDGADPPGPRNKDKARWLSPAQCGELLDAARRWLAGRQPKANPKCHCCGREGKTVDMPSQYDANTDLAPCDMVNIDLLDQLPEGKKLTTDTAADHWLCLGCHEDLALLVPVPDEEPKRKPKKARKPKLPPVTPEHAAFIHDHLCPAGPQTPLPEDPPTPTAEERPWQACSKCGGTGRVCRRCKRGEGRVTLKQDYCSCAAPDFDLCKKCGGNGRDYLKPKKAKAKAGPIPVCGSAGPGETTCTKERGHTGPHRWELFGLQAAGPVAGQCPNCGVRVDDDDASGPGALCDVCRLKARRKSGGAKGAKP